MTVSSDLVKMPPYEGDGETIVFQYTFKIYAASDLKVILRSVLGVEDTLILNTDYTVSGVGNANGGNVTLIGYHASNPPAEGELLVVMLDLLFLQLFDYLEGGDFPAESLEEAQDRCVKLLQMLKEKVGRALRFSPTSSLVDIFFPEGADQYIKWNAAGTALVCASVVAVQDYWEFLVSTPDAKKYVRVGDAGDNIVVGTLAEETTEFDFGAKNIKSTGLVKDIKTINLADFSEVTISGGVATVTQACHTIAPQTGNADDLDTITGVNAGGFVLIAPKSGKVITVKHNTGNIWLQGKQDIDLDDDNDALMLWKFGTKMVDVSPGTPAPPITRKTRIKIPAGAFATRYASGWAEAKSIEGSNHDWEELWFDAVNERADLPTWRLSGWDGTPFTVRIGFKTNATTGNIQVKVSFCGRDSATPGVWDATMTDHEIAAISTPAVAECGKEILAEINPTELSEGDWVGGKITRIDTPGPGILKIMYMEIEYNELEE
jgi:hypothetical protein